jgi:protease-4
MIRWFLMIIFSPLWLPRWLLGRALGRLRKRPTLLLVLRGSLPDMSSDPSWLARLRPPSGPELIPLLESIAAATRDPRIETLLVRIEELATGLARAEEVRAALARAREAGKRVVVYATELGLAGYWIALGGSSIRLAPTGSLNVSGLAMEFTLLEGLLSRAGVRAQLLARGKYKSAREMFTETAISEANREMLTSLVGDLSAQLADQVARARGRSIEEATAQIHAGPFRADEARERGLIDQTQYWDELWEEVGGEDSKVQTGAAYRKTQRRARFPLARRPQSVGLLRITGNIRTGHDRQGPNGPRATGSQSLRRALRQLSRAQDLAAIVVRIDSPGGSALASDLMWRELTLAAKKKPLFVSMANIAASGGYYTACIDGVPVWASPTTLTGSIGVVGGKFEISELLSRLGIRRTAIGSGPHADYYSSSRPWHTEELEKLERDLDSLYQDFVNKMASGRHLSFDALHAVAQGRVWTGKQAREVALVDRLGGLHEVALAVRERLGLSADAPLSWNLPKQPSGLGARRALAAEDARLSAWCEALPEALRQALPELERALDHASDFGAERLFAIAQVDLRLRT